MRNEIFSLLQELNYESIDASYYGFVEDVETSSYFGTVESIELQGHWMYVWSDYFLDYCVEEDVRIYYTACDVILHNSTDGELLYIFSLDK